MIVLRKGDLELERYVVSIAKGFAPVTFTKSGEITVDIMVVYPDNDTPVYRMMQLFEERNRSNYYRFRVYTGYDGEIYDYWHEDLSRSRRSRFVTARRYDHVATHKFVVLQDNFAKPPRPITQSFLSVYYNPDEYDQCDVRGKIIKSSVKTIFMLPLHYLFKFIGVVLFSITGFIYGLQYKEALKPYRHGSFSAVFGGVKPHSAWYYKKDNYDCDVLRPEAWVVPFTISLILLFVFSMVGLLSGSIWYALFTVGIVLGLIVLFVGGAMIIDAISGSKFRDNRKVARAAKQEARKAEESKYLASLLEEISCNTTGEPMTIERLVERRKHAPTVVFRNLKEKVCLPYEK